MRDFAGWSADATYLWPRWFVLRCVGAVYLIVFGGIIAEGPALVGAHGILPMAGLCAHLQELFPHGLERFLRAPSVFWFGGNPVLVAFLPWVGLAAAAALLLNLWPRLALFTCWGVMLSFVSMWQLFSPSIVDPLVLEVALLCIPFAPAGLRPGLGAASPPPAIAVFALRWLVFRIMFESGLIKLFAGNPHWRDFTAMDIVHETNPAPTVLAYFAFHLPHAYHLGELALTFVAELAAPLLAVFAGRRGRWFALGVWIVLQAGIQATANFGWLNTSAIALAVLLLDDQMLAAAAQKLRWRRFVQPPVPAPPSPGGWRRRALMALVALHGAVTVYVFAGTLAGRVSPPAPDPVRQPLDYLFRDFRSANSYVPFATFHDVRYELEFAGSNDGGATWRTWPFRYKPQAEDRMSPFLAPRFARFETALQLALDEQSPVIPRIAAQLLRRNPEVMALFASDPFPDRPPMVVRMLVHRYAYTDRATHRQTGRYWNKEYQGDFSAPLYLDERGEIKQAALP